MIKSQILITSIILLSVKTVFDSCLNINELKYYKTDDSSCLNALYDVYLGYHANLKDTGLKLLAKGSYGQVFECRMISSNGKVFKYALKAIPVFDNKDDNTKMIEKEIAYHNIVNGLNDLRLPLYYGCIVNDSSTVYILMEYFDSDVFDAILPPKNKKDIDTDKIYKDKWINNFYNKFDFRINFFLNMALSIKSLHDKGLAHFDIKPENIGFKSKLGIGKPIDFGLMYVVDKDKFQEISDRSKIDMKLLSGKFNWKRSGTLSYRDPNIKEGYVPNKKSDIYSLGITFTKILALVLHRKNLVTSEILNECGIRIDKCYKNNCIREIVNNFLGTKEQNKELYKLLKKMVKKDMNDRYTIDKVIKKLKNLSLSDNTSDQSDILISYYKKHLHELNPPIFILDDIINRDKKRKKYKVKSLEGLYKQFYLDYTNAKKKYEPEESILKETRRSKRIVREGKEYKNVVKVGKSSRFCISCIPRKRNNKKVLI